MNNQPGFSLSVAKDKPQIKAMRPKPCALAVAMALTTTVASSAVIRVDGNDVFFSFDGSCSIREAIIAANTDTAVDSCPAGDGADTIILVGRGQYVLRNFHEDLQGHNGLPTITSDITIRGNNAVIKREADEGFDTFRIFRVDNGSLSISDLTIENGVADFTGNGTFGPGVYGGGIVATDAVVTIQSSTITGNSATTGGGVSINNTDLTIIDSTISNNQGSGVNADKSKINIQNSTVSYNQGNIGGGLNLIRTTLTMNNSTINGNQSGSYGGGVDGQYSQVLISDSTIRNNFTERYDGGGLHVGDSYLSLSGTTVANNSSGRDGGGVKLDEQSSGTILTSTISKNSASRGGGGVEVWTNSLNIGNSTISGNTAQTLGGGVTAWYGAQVAVTNSTIAENSANRGSGAFNDDKNSQISFRNCIVASGRNAQNCAGGRTIDMGNNVFDDESCSGQANGNPRLGPLQINGKTTLATHALLGGSAAIDAGDSSICEGGLVANLDQRGLKRPFDGDGDGSAICDIGAHENQSVEAPPVGGGIQPAHSGVWFDSKRDGEGYFIYVSDIGGQRTVTMTYYTYDKGNQMWLIGSQAITPGLSTVTLPMTVTTGTSFSNFNPGEINRNDWGTLTLTFNSCKTGTISYSSPEFGAGDINITPLATSSGLACNEDGF
ncbi:MAG: right-handed parallel beta-helix repeat-containing protein [Gammaproteobacteria bacterium]|nr:right-handed parallel beta-helix repeat-containing protein [Gammaproteobacteria bacterium]